MNEFALVLLIFGSGISQSAGITTLPFKFEQEADCRAAGKAWARSNSRGYACLPLKAPPAVATLKPFPEPSGLGAPKVARLPPPKKKEAIRPDDQHP